MSLAAIVVALGVCLWQNHALLHIINAPLAHQTQKQVRAGAGRSERRTPSSGNVHE